MAQQNAAEFEEQATTWKDELLQTYITDLGQTLVTAAPPRPFRYRFRVVNDPTVKCIHLWDALERYLALVPEAEDAELVQNYIRELKQ